MKKHILLAMVALVGFGLSSCKKSLADETADAMCNCPASKDIIALKKSMDGKSDDEKTNIQTKLTASLQAMNGCLSGVMEKIKALPTEEMAKFDVAGKAAVQKKCPDLAAVMNDK
jgi:hypothetical protein